MSTIEEAPTFTPPSNRTRLSDVVPFEVFRPARLVLMYSYLAGYLWWLRYKGITVDRISVAISVGLFLLCAFVGKTWRTWGVVLLGCLFYSVMWLTYERTRDLADEGIVFFHLFRIKFPLQLLYARDLDRLMFFGHDPTAVLQRHFHERGVVRWYDVVASSAYMSHFVFPAAAMAVLWAVSQRQWWRFMKRFATLLFLACILFVILPTAPPWMVSQNFHLMERLDPRFTGSGIAHIGFHRFVADYNIVLTKGNTVAAMPSLHASFALVVPLFFMRWIRQKWVKAVLLLFPFIMLTSLVYFGEHWVIDGLIGWVITVGAFMWWDAVEQRTRVVRSERARAALAPA